MAADLNAKDLERAKFSFSIYDFDGSGSMDAFYVGDVLRALNLTPTLKLVEKLGGTKKKGEKKFKIDEFLPVFSAAKKDKDVGNISDYMECLKLYDKANDGRMIGAELSHILQALGENMNAEETASIIKDCCEAEDEEGFVPYGSFLKTLIAGPFPEAE